VTPPFVSVTELRGRCSSPEGGPVLVDVRYALDGSEGRHTYRQGHLPDAVFADVDVDLAAPATDRGGRHPLPSPDRFAATLGRLGIRASDEVVAYDTAAGIFAARLVWMLRAIGQRAAVLSGGLAAWGGPLEVGEVRRAPVDRHPVPWPVERLVDADGVAALASDPGAVVVDARAASRFRGDEEPIDARAGHVPGAVNLPTAALIGADGHLLDASELRAVVQPTGALDAPQVAGYCGSGVTACFDLLALEALGVRGRLYPGSWSAWSADPARPAAIGGR
jgi:thiosulfate/3-mercaptopyruvate sulfurtransferase